MAPAVQEGHRFLHPEPIHYHLKVHRSKANNTCYRLKPLWARWRKINARDSPHWFWVSAKPSPRCDHKSPALCPYPVLLWLPLKEHLKRLFFLIDCPWSVNHTNKCPSAYVLCVYLSFSSKIRKIFLVLPSTKTQASPGCEHPLPSVNVHPNPNHPLMRAVFW